MDSNDFALGYAMADNGNSGNGNNGWGGDNGWWIIIVLFALFGGWNGNGMFGGNNGGGALTRSDLCQDMNFSDLENAVRATQRGISDSTYALNNTIVNGFANNARDLCTGLSAVNAGIAENRFANQQCCCDTISAITNAQFAAQTGMNALATQLAECCCTTNRNIERGFADANYNLATQSCAIQTAMANNTRDIIDSQRDGTRAILDWLCAKETADLRTENQNLKLAASQAAQNNYLVNQLRPCPIPSYNVCNPFTGSYGGYAGYGNAYNNNCNCNTSCGCC